VRTTGRQVKKSTPTRPSVPLIRWLAGVLVVLITLLAFLPALQNGFVTWDDGKNIYQNPNYRGLGWAQLRWMFTTFHMGNYRPLTWATFGVDYLIWQVDPFGYHLTSLVLHTANALLFYFIVLRLFSLSSPFVPDDLSLCAAAGFGALVFSIHPLRVEAVVWASALNHVLSSLFFLATILCYLRAATGVEGSSVRRRWLTSSVALYGLSLLSQPSALTLPFVLLMLDVYPLRRLGDGAGSWFELRARRIWWEKLPFLLLALGAALIAVLAKEQTGALASLAGYGVGSRLLQGLFGMIFYLWKTIFPVGLSPLYELPAEFHFWDPPFLLSGVLFLIINAALYRVRRALPAALFSWIYYLVVLGPFLGSAQSGPQMVADRYSYLACLGWAVLGGAGLLSLRRTWGGRKIGARTFIFASGIGCSIAVILGVLTWKQTEIWHDSETLWRHALSVTRGSSTIDFNLAVVLHNHGKLEEAIEHYRRSLRFNPNIADAHYYLADALAERGEVKEAVKEYNRAIQIDPGLWRAHFNLAKVLASQGNREGAVEHYLEVVKIEPAFIDAHYQLGNVLAALGDFDTAVQHYEKALKLDPSRSEIHLNLGNALIRRGRLDEAAAHFETAIRLKPDMVKAYNNLGMLMAAQGRLDSAIGLFRQALRIEPEFAEAHENLAMALSQAGRKDEATKNYQEAIKILKSRRRNDIR
jgi:tetratricopeptide (TPR) repeat protein